MTRVDNEWKRLRSLTPEQLDAEIEFHRRAALPRWLVLTCVTVALLGLVASVVLR